MNPRLALTAMFACGLSLSGCAPKECGQNLRDVQVIIINDNSVLASVNGTKVRFDIEPELMLRALGGGDGISISGAWCLRSEDKSFYIIELNGSRYVRAERADRGE